MYAFLKKNLLANIFFRKIYFFLQKLSFSNSETYWENRYRSGGNSGKGSYDSSAEFKESVLNTFIKENNIETVLELGCGDGNQLKGMRYKKYIGLDVSKKSIEICSQKFLKDNNKSFFLYSPEYFHDNADVFKVDLTLSLDVIYHLVEDNIYNLHLDHIFNCSSKYVVVFSNNETSQNINPHVKNRNFTKDVTSKFPQWELDQVVLNPIQVHGHTPKINFYIYKKLS